MQLTENVTLGQPNLSSLLMHRFLVALVVGLLLVGGAATAQVPGTCEPAVGESELAAGNVRARLLNNGQYFWRGSPHVYEVPRGSGKNAIFTSSLIVGGIAGRGGLRMAGSTYGPYEFWAGPLNDDGSPPTECDRYDRIWNISRADLEAYERGEIPSPDLVDWPTGLGAPTVDAGGTLLDLAGLPLALRADRKIDLDAGERPAIRGDQMLWWIMNDQGNVHNRTDSEPIGLEVHHSAWAYASPGPLGLATFYSAKLIKPRAPVLEQVYVGFNQDADLGDFQDDYVGSDSLLGLAYTYNSDNFDDRDEGYGEAPPAVGLDILRGGRVAPDGRDNDRDGLIDEAGETQAMSAFVYYSGGSSIMGDVGWAEDFYNYMQGRWKDGQRFTEGGNGRDFSSRPTGFLYSGMPPGYWSEFDVDGRGTSRPPSDRRWMAAAGPFELKPGEPQEITWAVITAFGADNLDSVRLLKEYSSAIQRLADADFRAATPPDPPSVRASPGERSALLVWDNDPASNNFADAFAAADPFDLSEGPSMYRFEGYRILQFEDASDTRGRLVETYDLKNGIKTIPGWYGPTTVGRDNGLQHHHLVSGLTNYTEYAFGVQPFAVNPSAQSPVLWGDVARVTVVPGPGNASIPAQASALALAAADSILAGQGVLKAQPVAGNVGRADISANLVDPASVTGLDYSVSFEYLTDVRPLDTETGRGLLDTVTPTQEMPLCFNGFGVRRSDGSLLLSADQTLAGGQAIQGADVFRADGLSFNVHPEAQDFADFLAVAFPPHSLMTPIGASGDWAGFPGVGRPNLQTGTLEGPWLVHAGLPENGLDRDYTDFVDRVFRGRCNTAAPFDYEIRFTSRGSLNFDRFGRNGGGIRPDPVPFELWNIGIGTPDDPSDDFRMIPAVIDWAGDGWGMQQEDHPLSTGTNDPYTDWVYWIEPADTSPGEVGYQAWADNAAGGGNPLTHLGPEVMARMVLISWNGSEGDATGPKSTFDHPDGPRLGTTLRIVSHRPPQPGDRFTLSTAGLEPGPLSPQQRWAREEQMGISPNPFRSTSSYSVAAGQDEVRFVGLPERVTIRVFTLAGSLVRSFQKNSPAPWMPWDLRTEDGRELATGMYLVSFETEDGPVTRQFGVIRARR